MAAFEAACEQRWQRYHKDLMLGDMSHGQHCSSSLNQGMVCELLDSFLAYELLVPQLQLFPSCAGFVVA